MSTATATQETNTQSLAHLAGKYLTFFLGGETYGIPVLKVREIISLLPITPVPQVPAYMKGVINLRGKVIPVVDLRTKFQLPEAEATGNTCIVVVQVGQTAHSQGKLVGIIVDAVEEVANVNAADIEPTPDFGTSLSVDYILGMAKLKGVVKALLDIDKIISAEGVEAISSQAAA
ncbi:MAG: chemotaxis protein CheW [Chthoniobacterales bacterium]|nr:chemotaxis protein CheW [Chthoniobacterales bacterium]